MRWVPTRNGQESDACPRHTTGGVTLVLSAIVDDRIMIRNVSGFLTLCLACFALVGVTLYHGSLQYDCVENAPSSLNRPGPPAAVKRPSRFP
jgi:hypothetical protein